MFIVLMTRKSAHIFRRQKNNDLSIIYHKYI